MATLMTQLGIDKLSLEQQLQLVDEIWDSLGPARSRAPLTPAQKAEIERRLALHKANPDEGATWEEVRAELMEDE